MSWALWYIFGPDRPNTEDFLWVVGFVAIALIIWVPKLQDYLARSSSPVERFTVENEARRTLATVTAGLAVFISFY